MAQLNKINLVFEVSAPRADLLDDVATQVALTSLGEEYVITKLDFKEVRGVQYPPGVWTWTTEAVVAADHI